MTSTRDNPWLHISAADYELHMDANGQAAALRQAFARVYGAVRPGRALILGCTTARDFLLIDPAVTERAVGVDLNSDYLAAARRLVRLPGVRVEFVQGDVLAMDLAGEAFDLVHAALLIEHVDPVRLLGRMAGWLAPAGTCSVVSQNPVAGRPLVSPTGRDTLLLLDGHMSLLSPHQIAACALQAGLVRTSLTEFPTPEGKCLAVSTFVHAPPAGG